MKITTIQEFIKSKKWYYNNSEITEDNFPMPKTVETEGAEIVRLKVYISSEECLALIKSKGLRPANIYELMIYISKHPESFPESKWTGIIALGSEWTDSDGRRRVPFVDRYSDGDWELNLGFFEHVWGVDSCLLCFRDKSSDTSILSESSNSDPLSLKDLELARAIEICKANGLTISKIY